MAKATISTSIRADRNYLEAVRRVGFRRDMVIADITRQAIDKYLGDELKKELKNFAPDGHENVHSDAEATAHVA